MASPLLFGNFPAYERHDKQAPSNNQGEPSMFQKRSPHVGLTHYR